MSRESGEGPDVPGEAAVRRAAQEVLDENLAATGEGGFVPEFPAPPVARQLAAVVPGGQGRNSTRPGSCHAPVGTPTCSNTGCLSTC
jgi:hypothetical protein